MILSRLLYYKSDMPVSYLPRRKPNSPMFDNPELNRLIDENYDQVLREGTGKIPIPARLHTITRDSLTENAKKTADILIGNGFKAYLSGGAVRDLIRGGTVNDFDFTTDATNDDLRRILPGIRFHSIPSGHEFGYVVYGDETVDVMPMLNIPAAYYGLPKMPEFDPEALYSGSIQCDAMERDITINCLYYDVGTGDLIDPTGGMHDLREGIVSTPVRNHIRLVLRTDPRIILRSLRFKSRFGFELSEELDEGIRELGPELILKDSPEMIYLNLPEFFSGGYAGEGVQVLLKYGLMRGLFPALGDLADLPDYREYAVKTCRAVDWIFDEGTNSLPLLAMAALLWPAVSRLERQGAADPAGEVLRMQRKVIAISEEEAAFLYSSLQISRVTDREEIHRQIVSVFGESRFEDALGMLQIHYWMKPVEVGDKT